MIDDLTKDINKVLQAIAWREAAVADGWTAEPTYKHEPYERASRHTKEGFICTILARVNDGGLHEASVSIWGPDRLVVKAPIVYDWQTIKDGLRRCGYCHATDVDTERVSFAGRCCAKCRPAVSAKLEQPGWCD